MADIKEMIEHPKLLRGISDHPWKKRLLIQMIFHRILGHATRGHGDDGGHENSCCQAAPSRTTNIGTTWTIVPTRTSR